MFNVALISQDDISNEKSPCGSKSYLINLKEQLEDKIQLIYIGPFSNFKNTKRSYQKRIITKNNNSTIKFLFLLFLKTPWLKLPLNTLFHAQKPLELLPFILFYRNKKKVLTLHGQELKRIRYKKSKLFLFFYCIAEQIVLKKTDLIIAVDRETKYYYLEEYPWIKNKIKIIPIGINFSKFIPKTKLNFNSIIEQKTDYKTIIFVGRLEIEKNLLFLIKAYDKVKKKYPDVELLIVGGGNQKSELEEFVYNNKLEDIHFTGEVENKKIPDLMNYADVFALCSIYEGSPTVVKEALACNTPVVSFDVGDVKEVIEKLEGSFIADRNIEDFSNKIINVLNNANPYNSRKNVSRFSYKEIGERTLKLYQSLMKDE